MQITTTLDNRESAKKTSASPAVLLLALQISSRLFTFALNQAMIRVSDPALYGTAHIKLEIVLSLLLTLSREAIRGASLRQPGSSASQSGHVAPTEVRILHLLPIAIGFLVTTVVTASLRLSQTDLESKSLDLGTAYLYLAAGALELLAEPIYLHALSPYGGGNVTLRVRVEGTAAVFKGLVTLGSTLILRRLQLGRISHINPLVCFGLGQLAYGSAVLATFFIGYIRKFGLRFTLRLYWPINGAQDNRDNPAQHWHRPLYSLVAVLFLQSVVKYLATEADKLAVSQLGSPEDQGGYALGSNYASLPLRLLFQPLEESTRLHFSRRRLDQLTREPHASELNSITEKQRSSDTATRPDQRPQPASPVSVQSPSTHRSSHVLDCTLSTLRSLLRLHSIVGLLTVCYLPPLSALLIEILSGTQWTATSAVRTLSAYAFFLPVAGYSGILEGFIQSTGDEAELRKYNQTIVASSITFFLTLWLSSWIGPFSTEEHLILASILSMLFRTRAAWTFAKRAFGADVLSFRSLMPRTETILLATAGGILTRWAVWREGVLPVAAEDLFKGHMHLLCVSISTGLTCICSLFLFDRKAILQIYDTVRSRI